MTTQPKSVVFIHPDLGIGGAERLVVDAAVGLQSLGHKVTVFTSYRDPAHCFEEARDGTLDVRVRGDSLFPTSLAGRFSILFTILRQIALVFSTSILSSDLHRVDPDVFFIDQLSTCVPLLRYLFPRAKILFYGHFPDRLLVKEEDGIRKTLKHLYRLPFDALEGWSTSCADSIVVNSKFTRSTFRKTFPALRARDLKVIYPCVDTTISPSSASAVFPNHKLLLSINRFEHKKNLALALHAFSALPPSERLSARLVLAGGFDPRNPENASCLLSLQTLATSLGLSHATFKGTSIPSSEALAQDPNEVFFLLSIPSSLKTQLLSSAKILLYTPENEHFGIVPLEAMLAGVPVLATNSGGPLETIYDGRTGWLRSKEKVAAWTEVMRKPMIGSAEEGLQAMGRRGRERVLAEFSREKMIGALDGEVRRLVASGERRPEVLSGKVLGVIGGIVLAVLGAVIGLVLAVGRVRGW